MIKTELEWEEGIIDSSGLKNNPEELKEVMRIIEQRVAQQTPAERLRIKTVGVYYEMEDYVQQAVEDQAGELRTVGYFLKKMLDIYQVSSEKFAEYTGIQNVKQILAGQQNIDAAIAQQLGKIFAMQSAIWIKVMNKNELWRVQHQQFSTTKNISIMDISPALAA